MRQRVHQPRLATGLPPHRGQRSPGERLARLRGVLAEQGAHVRLVEVPQPQRLGLDVERASAGDDLARGSRADTVIAHVANPAQDDALREEGGARFVAGAQLAQHRDEGIADQRVDLVDEQDQRPRIGFGPARQYLAQRPHGPGQLQGAGDKRLERTVAKRDARLPAQLVEEGAHGHADVLAGGLAFLEVHVDAAVLAAAVEEVPEGQQRRGLAGLARRAQHEVALGPYQTEDLVEIEAFPRTPLAWIPNARK